MLMSVTEGAEVLPMGTLVVLIQRDHCMVFAVGPAMAGKIDLQASVKMQQLARKVF